MIRAETKWTFFISGKWEKLYSRRGFSLVELMFVVAILGAVFSGMIRLFISSSALASISGNKTVAISEAQNKIEEIRNYPFGDIVSDYAFGGSQGNTFALTSPTGTGVVGIDSTNAELLVIEVGVSWQDRFGRIVGEDLDLDGALDAGEDKNGNGELDHGVKVMTMLTRR